MEKHEIKTENFHCLKLNARAILTYEYRIDDENNKILVRFDCDKKLDCGIAKKGNGDWTYDWGPCTPYSTLEKKRFRI